AFNLGFLVIISPFSPTSGSSSSTFSPLATRIVFINSSCFSFHSGVFLLLPGLVVVPVVSVVALLLTSCYFDLIFLFIKAAGGVGGTKPSITAPFSSVSRRCCDETNTFRFLLDSFVLEQI